MILNESKVGMTVINTINIHGDDRFRHGNEQYIYARWFRTTKTKTNDEALALVA